MLPHPDPFSNFNKYNIRKRFNLGRCSLNAWIGHSDLFCKFFVFFVHNLDHISGSHDSLAAKLGENIPYIISHTGQRHLFEDGLVKSRPARLFVHVCIYSQLPPSPRVSCFTGTGKLSSPSVFMIKYEKYWFIGGCCEMNAWVDANMSFSHITKIIFWKPARWEQALKPKKLESPYTNLLVGKSWPSANAFEGGGGRT